MPQEEVAVATEEIVLDETVTSELPAPEATGVTVEALPVEIYQEPEPTTAEEKNFSVEEAASEEN